MLLIVFTIALISFTFVVGGHPQVSDGVVIVKGRQLGRGGIPAFNEQVILPSIPRMSISMEITVPFFSPYWSVVEDLGVTRSGSVVEVGEAESGVIRPRLGHQMVVRMVSIDP